MKKITILFLVLVALISEVTAQSAACQVDISANWQTTPDWTVFNPVATTVCVGDDIDFDVTFDGSYDWTLTSTYPGFSSRSGLGQNSMVETHANVVFTGTFDYTLTLIGSACNRDTTISISILSPPIADVIADDEEVCDGTTVNYTANGGAPGSSTYDWTVNGAPAVGYDPALETYSYVPLDGDLVNCSISNGACSDVDDTDVAMIVHANPVAVATFDDLNLIGEFCDQQTAVIAESNLDPATIASYQFFVAGSALPNVLNDSLETFNADLTTYDGQSAYVVVIDNNGCTHTSNVLTIDVSQLPDLTGAPTKYDACMSEYMTIDIPGFVGETAGSWNVTIWNTAHTIEYPIVNSIPALPTNGAVTIDIDIPGGTPGFDIKIEEITTGCLNF